MRELYTELIEELDGMAEDINPTPPDPNTREIEPEEIEPEEKPEVKKSRRK